MVGLSGLLKQLPGFIPLPPDLVVLLPGLVPLPPDLLPAQNDLSRRSCQPSIVQSV